MLLFVFLMVAAQSRTALLKVSLDSTSWEKGAAVIVVVAEEEEEEEEEKCYRWQVTVSKQDGNTSHVTRHTSHVASCTSPASL
jgi:hypothetical protein